MKSGVGFPLPWRLEDPSASWPRAPPGAAFPLLPPCTRLQEMGLLQDRDGTDTNEDPMAETERGPRGQGHRALVYFEMYRSSHSIHDRFFIIIIKSRFIIQRS